MTNLVSIHDGKVTVSSLTIAEHFNKQHAHVLRVIRNAECSEEFGRSNFGLSYYTNKQNKQQPFYCITRDGFMFLVMGFTGKEAAMWKERFINAFNEMEEKLRQQQQSTAILERFRGKTLKAYIDPYGGKLSFQVEEPEKFWENAIKAISDRTNYGLKDETIIQVANACFGALAYRAKSRGEAVVKVRRQLAEMKAAKAQQSQLDLAGGAK